MSGNQHSNITVWDCSYQPYVWVPGTIKGSILPLYNTNQAANMQADSKKVPSPQASQSKQSCGGAESANCDDDPLDNV